MNSKPFEHRGFMLDVCRHYMPVENIKKLISAASVLKMNRMHWHLSDDQGWRVEIKKYPYLTEKGAFRGTSYFGGIDPEENNDGFYTQDEIKDIVSFAKKRGIEIIPEIEMPGHASALLHAYPEYGCRDHYDIQLSLGIFPEIICAGKDTTLTFLENILNEITELFPFPMVHIGGDEALKLHWRRCPDCQRRMKALGLRTEDELQRWLVLKIGEFLNSKGRKTIVWNDVLKGGLLPDYFIVQQWLDGEKTTVEFMETGGQIIISDTKSYYMDYAYGRIDLHHIYEYPRIPDYAKGLEDRVLGIECPLWTERVTNIERASELLFPRMAGVAMKAAGEDNLPWEIYKERIRESLKEVEDLGLKSADESLWFMSEEEAEKDRETAYNRNYLPDAFPHIKYELEMVLLDKTEIFMRKLGIPEEFILTSGDVVLNKEKPAAGKPYTALVEKELTKDDISPDGKEILIQQMMQAVRNREEGVWKKYPEEIWTDTMKCFPRFIREHRISYGYDGFDRYFWTVRQVNAKLFRIGELEYEKVEKDRKPYVISLHIPSDVRLEEELLNDSLRKAKNFFETYNPEWRDLPIVCESWLLSPVLLDMLSENSNIRHFQEAFCITETDPDDSGVLEWVFHLAGAQQQSCDFNKLPEDTSLQKKIKALLLKGGHVGSGTGKLIRDFNSKSV